MASSSWDSLPLALLGRCLRLGAPSDQLARFATCTSFTKAMLLPDPDLTETQLTVHVDDFDLALASVQRWAEDCRFRLQLSVLDEDQPPWSLGPLLAAWQHEGVILRGVRKVVCKGVQLADDDSLLPALLPNLQELQLEDCQLAEGTLCLSGCSKLQKLALDPGCQDRSDHLTTPAATWYPQLANLPSLASLALSTCCHPTSFLPLLAGQLTHLHLWGMCEDAPVVRHATAQHTAQLTNLRALYISHCCSPEVLATLRALPHLQQLTLDDALGHGDTSPFYDDHITALLQLPHLTSLTLPCVYALQQSYADQPCSWRELTITVMVTPQTLARLPLQSVSTLRLQGLDLRVNLEADDVELAVANLTRGQPRRVLSKPCVGAGAAFSIYVEVAEGEPVDEQQAASIAARFCGIAPLVPQDITSVMAGTRCCGEQWPANSATVVALQQAVPPTITKVEFHECFTGPSFWPQLAMSLPLLKKLRIQPTHKCSAEEVMAYYTAACLAHYLPGVPQVADVEINPSLLKDYDDDYDAGTDEWISSLTGVNEQLRLLGLNATVSVVTE